MGPHKQQMHLVLHLPWRNSVRMGNEELLQGHQRPKEPLREQVVASGTVLQGLELLQGQGPMLIHPHIIPTQSSQIP